MVKKKIDERIRTLIENGVKLKHRCVPLCARSDSATRCKDSPDPLRTAALHARGFIDHCADPHFPSPTFSQPARLRNPPLPLSRSIPLLICRTMFVIVGDHGREQVVNLHYILSKASVRARPNVLWCYKKGQRASEPAVWAGERTLRGKKVP